jgi:peptidoglycan/xylan/chitin deacetylase (PgdA/CDA1 family)
MRLFRPCFLAERFFPEALFREKTSEKKLYLTFDDGPDPLSTLPLLNILAKNNVRALFFCSGKAAEENPDLVNRIRSEGHLVGNHGHNHPDGFYTSKNRYLADIRAAEEFTSNSIFRPPYGRLRLSQYFEIKNKYHIIMWDIMPYDFDEKFGSRSSLAVLKKKIRPGSVIVLHDTSKSCAAIILNDFLEFAVNDGFRFVLPEKKFRPKMRSPA